MISLSQCELAQISSRLSSGKSISSEAISEHGKYPVYGGNGLRGYTSSCNFKGECAIIGRQGAFCGNVRFFSGEAYMTEHAVVFCANADNDTRYIAYALSRMNLGTLSGQSAQPGLSVKTLSKLLINLPNLECQRKVSRILRALEDKIELNAQINHNLEEQAKAIFKSWFVDFEPFQDGKFVDSELGRIPQGWRLGTLSDIADVTMGQSPKGDTYNEEGQGTVFYQGRAEFSDRFPQRRLFTTEPKRMAVGGDILLSVRAPVGDMNIANESCCIGRGLAAIHAKDGCQSFVFYTMSSIHGELDKYNGEGTVFGCINKDALNEQKVIFPPMKIVRDFEEIVAPLDHQYLIGAEEKMRLAQLRDTLLPKLMSGEIDVSEVVI